MRPIWTSTHLVILLTLSLICPLEEVSARDAVCDRDPSTAIVFVGVLTQLEATDPNRGWTSAKFHVLEALQGQVPDEVPILMADNLCRNQGVIPTISASYLVFTEAYPKSGYSQLERCEQLRPIDKATVELQYLRSSQQALTPTEISGEARVETRGGYPRNRLALPGTKIHLSAKGRVVDLVSDSDGRFHGILNPGKYEVTADFPVGYKAEYCGPAEITVSEHRCTEVSVCAHPTASFVAHIVDVDGESLNPLVSNVQLTLATADDNQFVRSIWPNEKGDLEGTDLLPGKYVLGLNTYLPVTPGTEYPPIYFPGVRARSEAQVIELADGEHKVLPEMRIKKGKGCEIPILVTDLMGKPSASAIVALAYSDYPNFYTEPNQHTDRNGNESVYAVFPGPVFLRAEKQREDGLTAVSEELEVSSCPATVVLLKLTHAVKQQDPD